MTETIWILAAVVGAIALDLMILWIWRWRAQRRAGKPEGEGRSSQRLPPRSVSTSEEIRGGGGTSATPSASDADDSREIALDLRVPAGSSVRLTIEALDPEESDAGARILVQGVEVIPGGTPQVLEPEPIPTPGAESAEPVARPTGATERAEAKSLQPFWEDWLDLLRAAPTLAQPREAWRRATAWAPQLALALFAASIVIYGLVRFLGLAEFPIYFFTDEAVQTVLASDLIRDGFKDHTGTLLPTFFENSSLYNLSVTVYMQVLPTLLFERSVFLTRSVSVVTTIFGAIGLALILKEIFHLRTWWPGILLLSMAPVWFLHSRTAFETVTMVSLYLWFLYFYMRYRTRDPSYLYVSLLFGGLTFYSYSPGQLIMVGSGLLLLISDAAYHWHHRRTAARGAALIVLMALPYLRFQLSHPGETYFHLRMLDSYWTHSVSFTEKAQTFLSNYALSLSPAYWYFPNGRDLIRHRMDGLGHILWITLPFALGGLWLSLRRWREARHRTVLVSLFVAPLGTSIVGIGVTRVLVFLVPATIYTALGLEWLLQRLRRKLPESPTDLAAFALLASINLFLLRAALVDGPTWFEDYGLYGMQYGARQVFTEVRQHVEANPEDEVLVSPTWTNGANVLALFFLPEAKSVELKNIDAYMDSQLELDEDALFVMTPDEYEKAVNSPKFTDPRVEKVLPYPNGEPGFYFARLHYVEEVERIFREEAEERRKLVVEEATIDGQRVTVEHTPFDLGTINDVFDQDAFTLARTHEINPARVNLVLPAPRVVNAIVITTGSMDIELEVRAYREADAEPVLYQATWSDLPPDPTVQLNLDRGPEYITRLELVIEHMEALDQTSIHLREIRLK
jgi:hypothetical protein